MSAWRIVARGWRVFVPVVLINAVVQAATVAPALTPEPGAGFLALAAASFLAFSAASAAVAVAARAAVVGGRMPWPRWWVWFGSALAVLAMTASALLSPIAVPFAAVLALVVMPGIAAGDGLAGVRVFARRPWRAILLSIGSLLSIVVLWVGALLLGFFITGAIAAFATWLVSGAIAVVLVGAWTSLVSETARAGHAQHGSRP